MKASPVGLATSARRLNESGRDAFHRRSTMFHSEDEIRDAVERVLTIRGH
jgi:hypothetical protein